MKQRQMQSYSILRGWPETKPETDPSVAEFGRSVMK